MADDVDRLIADGDRITAALLAMDDHPGHRLLRGASLTGASRTRWEETAAAMVVLWEWYDVHRALLARCRDADPDLLRVLLATPVTEVDGTPLTSAGLLARMTGRHAEITAVLDEAHARCADRVALLTTPADRLRALPDTAVVAALRVRVAAARERALSDPLTPDPEVAGLVDEVAAVHRLHEGFADRMAALDGVVEEVVATRERARVVRARVVERIAGDHPDVPGDDLARTVAAVRARFPDVLENDVAQVERTAATSRDRARAVLEQLAGTLERRAELRGRLSAYQAKATRTGHAEDAELSDLHRRARSVLYSAPCDLRAATVAVGRYQRAVLDRTEAGR
ncbi:hypothetical protein GCM10022243_57050 [Saccharothrix violaceirubra]|uniref:Uncharacterized protein n=1 Tax=Saccharothrix violaceirubra TaxID=413306 RepID=A0A7W7T4G2_9PSEU|nr:hypothetical protein [Saccharothrix violaceirubra]MBB4965862.1 hypothetical protein [Saccharothrix violaceirubra]